MLSEVARVAANAHVWATSIPREDLARSLQEIHWGKHPQKLAEHLSGLVGLRSPRLERLAENLGVLAAPVSVKLSRLLSSLVVAEGMQEILAKADPLDSEAIKEIFDALLRLDEDAKAAHLALAQATGISNEAVRQLEEGLGQLPTNNPS